MSQEKKELEINLEDHENPEDFLRRCKQKYPDENVILFLDKSGKKLVVCIAEEVPTQIKTSTFSFLEDLARREMYA
jgi:hypothetical protein